MKLRIVLMTFLLCFISSACVPYVHSDGPYKGKVVDADTGESIQGAGVVAIWLIEPYVHSERYCDAHATLTDQNGNFEIPQGWCISHLFTEKGKPNFIIFKPGYDSYPPSLPVITPSFTQKDWEEKHKYQLEFWVEIAKQKNNLIKLKKAKSKEERMWIESHVSLGGIPGIPDDKFFIKVKQMIDLINQERKTFGLAPIYTKE